MRLGKRGARRRRGSRLRQTLRALAVLAGIDIFDSIEPLFRRFKRPNPPIFGDGMYRDIGCF